jgi:hypothetical protein
MNGIPVGKSQECEYCGQLCHKSNITRKYIHDSNGLVICTPMKEGQTVTHAKPKEV